MQLTPAVRNAIGNHFYALKMLLKRIESETSAQYKKEGGYLILEHELNSSTFIKLLGVLHYEKIPDSLPPINKTNLEKIEATIRKMEEFILEIFPAEILPRKTKFIEKWLG